MTTHTIDHHQDSANSRVLFGFWVYLMTDAIMFAALFATYAVLHNNIYGGPGIQQLTSLPYVFIETMILLCSTFICGLSFIVLQKGSKAQGMIALAITFLLGLAFLVFEGNQFMNLISQGITWQGSAFLSAFFTLILLHAAHVFIGLVWILVLLIQFTSQGATPTMRTRVACLGLFWGFLNIVWIFIFTIVYLMGVI